MVGSGLVDVRLYSPHRVSLPHKGSRMRIVLGMYILFLNSSSLGGPDCPRRRKRPRRSLSISQKPAGLDTDQFRRRTLPRVQTLKSAGDSRGTLRDDPARGGGGSCYTCCPHGCGYGICVFVEDELQQRFTKRGSGTLGLIAARLSLNFFKMRAGLFRIVADKEVWLVPVRGKEKSARKCGWYGHMIDICQISFAVLFLTSHMKINVGIANLFSEGYYFAT